MMDTMRSGERMGSGGLRGLQILLSGASGVRGGFDSHAFPPFLAALGCALALAAGSPAVAGAPVPMPPISAFSLGPIAVVEDTVLNDVLPKPPSETARVTAPQDTAVGRVVDLPRNTPTRTRTPQNDPRLRPTFQQPRWVMMRSLVVPGWGQFYNKAWLKGIAIAGGEAALITQ